ncbi:Fic family protein [Bacteroides sp. OttesenSCG-928-J23]|nr:Fic family protein [Bacteroides sp. OttesenSCG-928-J23]
MPNKVELSKEIIFSSSDPNVSRQISKLEKEGKLKKIAPRLYTSNTIDRVENIVKRNIIDILAWRYPGAVISHRSAKELRPTASGDFFLTTTQNKRITDIPGIVINLQKGSAASKDDMPYNGLFIAGEYRWMLENMQTSRKNGDESKVLPISIIENKLERILLIGNETKLNVYRDKLHSVALELGMTKEFEKINKIISALLATHSSEVLSTPSAKAMSAGIPFDAARGELFEILFDAIKDEYFVERANRNRDEESFRLFSFFESYFSNYIEGTEFEIDEAKQIVDSGIPIPRRDEDSHDILGTFRLLSNRAEMNRVPASVEELYSILQSRHSILLDGRPHLEPGIFKTKNNRAGNTEFVDHQLVKGTLNYGFKYYTALKDPFARAIYMMFMISEIHPFNDGNGRIARIMMNAELVKGDQTRIIVPTVFREDYLLALRKLTRQKAPNAYINVMAKLQKFSDNLYGTDFTELKEYLRICNAYEEPSQAKLEIINRTIR